MKEPKRIPLSEDLKNKEPKKIKLIANTDYILDEIEDENHQQNNQTSIQQLESNKTN
jgi:hypothetical protein